MLDLKVLSKSLKNQGRAYVSDIGEENRNPFKADEVLNDLG